MTHMPSTHDIVCLYAASHNLHANVSVLLNHFVAGPVAWWASVGVELHLGVDKLHMLATELKTED